MRVRLIQKYGVSIEFDGVAHYAFPSPEAILASSPEELRALKLTQRKAEYVYGIAEEAAKEEWAELYDLPDDQFVARLTALRRRGVLDSAVGVGARFGPPRCPSPRRPGVAARRFAPVPRRRTGVRREGRPAGRKVASLAQLCHCLSLRRHAVRVDITASSPVPLRPFSPLGESVTINRQGLKQARRKEVSNQMSSSHPEIDLPTDHILRQIIDAINANPEVREPLLRALLTEDFLALPKRMDKLENAVEELREETRAGFSAGQRPH